MITVDCHNIESIKNELLIYVADNVGAIPNLKYHEFILSPIEDDGTVGASYSARTGMSEALDTIRLKYGISSEIDGYLFAGDCSHPRIQNASNMVFRSRPGMFSIFD